MKSLTYIFIFVISLVSCNNINNNAKHLVNKYNAIKLEPNKTNKTFKLHKLKKLYIIGDFDGDGRKDTLFQHNYSKFDNQEIDSSASPYKNTWEQVVDCFYNKDATVFLALNKKNKDTLDLGIAQGLYCLINIGDNNNDKKDEIALVIDYIDFTMVNTCYIYTFCNNKWTLLKQFSIHEMAFEFYGDKMPIFNEIEDYLEKYRGKWIYNDFLINNNAEKWDYEKKNYLKLNKCK